MRSSLCTCTCTGLAIGGFKCYRTWIRLPHISQQLQFLSFFIALMVRWCLRSEQSTLTCDHSRFSDPTTAWELCRKTLLGQNSFTEIFSYLQFRCYYCLWSFFFPFRGYANKDIFIFIVPMVNKNLIKNPTKNKLGCVFSLNGHK